MTSPLQQKIKVTGPVVVTANRVFDGAVIYRRADGAWSVELDEAAVATDAALAAALIKAAMADGLGVIDPYLAPVKFAADGALRPGNLREAIRRAGPTVDLPAGSGI